MSHPMPEPPATPAVRAARRLAETRRFQLRGTALALAMHGSSEERIKAHNDAERAFEDAVAARVTAELLAGGVRLELERDGLDVDRLHFSAPVPNMLRWYLGSLTTTDSALAALTPPGTVHQAVLLMKPEEPK